MLSEGFEPKDPVGHWLLYGLKGQWWPMVPGENWKLKGKLVVDGQTNISSWQGVQNEKNLGSTNLGTFISKETAIQTLWHGQQPSKAPFHENFINICFRNIQKLFENMMKWHSLWLGCCTFLSCRPGMFCWSSRSTWASWRVSQGLEFIYDLRSSLFTPWCMIEK